MGEIIKMPGYSRKLKSMVTLPLKWVAIDCEYALDKVSNRYELMEISIYDIHESKELFTSKVRIKDPSTLSSWRKDNGYSEEDFLNAPSLPELDDWLSHSLKHCIGVFWNQQFDLQQYPMLAVHLNGTRDCMRRFSSAYGSYSPDFGDRSFDKLHIASAKAGIVLEEDEMFHTAPVDAKVTAELWKYCDQQDLPFQAIPTDLILRSEAEQIMEQLNLDLQVEMDEKSFLASENLELHNRIADLEETDQETDQTDQTENMSEDIPF